MNYDDMYNLEIDNKRERHRRIGFEENKEGIYEKETFATC